MRPCLKHAKYFGVQWRNAGVWMLWAATSALSVASPAGAESCSLSCDAGTFCYQNRCVAACSPPCPERSICAGYGECVPAPGPDNRLFSLRRLLAVDATYTERPNNGHFQSVEAIVLYGVFPMDRAALVPEIPIVYDMSLGSQTALISGNPTFTVHYHWLGPRLDVHAGGGVALPIATLENVDGGRFPAYLLATATQGLWNLWWYSSDSGAVVVPLGLRYVTEYGFDLRVEGATGLFFPIKSHADHDPLAALQLGVSMGYASPTFEAGLRLRAVRIPNTDAPDELQTSAEPYGRLFLGSAFVGAGFVMNLDPPLGPLIVRQRGVRIDPNSVWGLRVEAGIGF